MLLLELRIITYGPNLKPLWCAHCRKPLKPSQTFIVIPLCDPVKPLERTDLMIFHAPGCLTAAAAGAERN